MKTMAKVELGALRTFVLFIALSVLSACQLGQEPPLDQFNAEELYEQGQAALTSTRKPEKAVRYFQEIERRYPYSTWARRGLIMTAYSQHLARQYAEARASAQRFLETYPGDKDAPYAAYLIALSYYDQVEDVGRDQEVTFEALNALRQLIESFPDSEYTRSAKLKFDLAFNHLAGKEVEVGRYYLRKGNYVAAINRFKIVVEGFQTTSYTAEALHRLVEAYLALGLKEDAQTAAAILAYNYQASPFYQDSYNLLKSKGLAPEANSQGWLGQVYRQMVQGKWL